MVAVRNNNQATYTATRIETSGRASGYVHCVRAYPLAVCNLIIKLRTQLHVSTVLDIHMYCMSERRASERTDTLRACVRTYLNVRYGNCLHTYIWSPFAIVACGVRTYLNVRYGNCLHTYPHTCIVRTMRYRRMGIASFELLAYTIHTCVRM